jgi:hypothetical protein
MNGAPTPGAARLKHITKAALAVAKTGLPVFPTRNKKPAWSNKELGVAKGEGGYKIATTDPKEVRRLFEHARATEIAVPMGAMSGLICVDVDSHKSQAAVQWLRDHWELLKGALIHKTRSGGFHFIFEHPGESVRFFPATLSEGVDLKAGGTGYICWPGTEGYMDVEARDVEALF